MSTINENSNDNIPPKSNEESPNIQETPVIQESSDTKYIIIETKNEKETETEEKQTKKKVKKFRNTHTKERWITREIAEILGREYILLTTLRDTLFFMIFLILMTTVSLGAIETEAHNLFKLMETEMLHNNGFFNVHTPSQFWTFLDDFFENSFYWDYWYYPVYNIVPSNRNERFVFYENKLIGVPRLRQLKVRGDSCMIHSYFKKIFLSCYGKFNRNNEDTATFGPGTDTAWKYTPEDELQDSKHYGLFAWYHGGGFYKDLSLYRNKTKAIVEELKDNLWITHGTRAIFLDWTMYNTNLNLFMQFKLIFEFPRTGGIIPVPSAHLCSLLRYQTKHDYFILACELICILFLIYYTIEEIREILYFKWKYIFMVWSWVDLIIIAFGFAALGLRIYAEISIHAKLQHLIGKPDKHSNMQVLMQRMIYYKLLLSWQLFFIYMKIFKYLNFNKSMAQLNRTLSQCRRDMLGFGLMFFIIFIAFAILGYLIFGTEVETFSSFYIAMFTLLRTILGDFDYTDIEKANRIIAPIFFLMFIFLVFFVLLNMFLAIINDTYMDVKTELAIAPEEMRMSGFVKRGYYNMLIKLGLGKHVKFNEFAKNEFAMTTAEIKGALKRIGFTDLEIEMFLARYNIDPAADIQQFDVDTLIAKFEGKQTQDAKGASTNEQYNDAIVTMEDFIRQQDQLKKIEDTIQETTNALQVLLNKLENMENVRKSKIT